VLIGYAYLTVGGVETVLRARMEGLAAHGIDVDAWFLHDLGGRSVFAGLDHRVRVGGVDELAAALVRHDYDLVVTIDTPELLGPLAEAAGQPRLVVECHSPYLENLGYLAALPRHRPAAVLVPSEHQRRLVEALLGPPLDATAATPVLVVPNPLHTDLFAAIVDPPAQHGLPHPAVLWLGRMDDLKNWQGFLELGRELLALQPAAELWLVGRPAPGDDGTVRQRAKEAGVLASLRWLRGIPHQRVPALLDLVRASGGVLVSTSRGESFGMTVAEAMARGCGVAVPDNAPFDEFVLDGETGLRFPPEDPAAAARAVARLLADAPLRKRLGTEGRQLMIARHAPDVALAALASELYALAGRGAARAG
jgi:glycosyltransferase involved in cell wall biosynthesis